jgi:hypothetical protein
MSKRIRVGIIGANPDRGWAPPVSSLVCLSRRRGGTASPLGTAGGVRA